MAGPAMKLSAHNQRNGRIVGITRDATTTHICVGIGGAIGTAFTTIEAVDEPRLIDGPPAYVVLKASDVTIAAD